MASNRFDFLELNEEPVNLPVPTDSTSEGGVIRFDAPSSESVASVDEDRNAAGGMEQEVFYERKTMRVEEVFGSRGTVAGAFSYPTGIAIDRNGIIFVADAYNHRLQRITPDGGVAIVGSRGSARGQFVAPMGIAVDEDRSFYVVEQGNHRVQKFTADGVFQFAIGREGSRPGEFRSPMAIAVSRGTKNIYIADTGNGRVQSFNSSGVFQSMIGSPSGAGPYSSSPQSVACDYNGNVYVADTLTNRVLQFDPGGRFIAFYGGASITSNRSPDLTLTEPQALAFDERGRLYISDGLKTQGRMTAVMPEPGAVITTLENVGRGLGHLSRAGGIAACPVAKSRLEPRAERGDIYVCDTMNHRVLRFVWV